MESQNLTETVATNVQPLPKAAPSTRSLHERILACRTSADLAACRREVYEIRDETLRRDYQRTIQWVGLGVMKAEGNL